MIHAVSADRDVRTLLLFIDTFCREKHRFRDRVVAGEHALNGRPVFLCPDCCNLLEHALFCRANCAHEKPECMHCNAPCFGPQFERQIRQVMRFSGRYLAFHGHPQYLWRLLF